MYKSGMDRAYNVSTISVLNALRDDSPILTYPYTIFDETLVCRSRRELLELHTETNIPPRLLVTFKPKRLLLHEIIINMVTLIQLEDEKEMRAKVIAMYEAIKSALPHEVFAEITKNREQTVQQLQASLKQIKSNRYDAESKYVQQLLAMRIKFPRISDSSLIKLITDKLYSEHACAIIRDKVQRAIQYNINQEILTSIAPPEPCSRVSFMALGGQASGKGRAVTILHQRAATKNIAWKDLVKINTDSYKPLLLDSTTIHPKWYSQLVQEEASLIHSRIQDRLFSLVNSSAAPHIFVDQVFLGADKLDLATREEGDSICVVISTDVETAIERSYMRGEDTGRYEDTEGLLRGHKLMTQQIPDTLAKFPGKDISLHLIDNNMPVTDPVISIMGIEVKEQRIIIYDIAKLHRFIKKTIINIDTEMPSEIYDEKSTLSIPAYLEPLLILGFNITFEGISSEAAERHANAIAFHMYKWRDKTSAVPLGNTPKKMGPHA
jgi:hypothetical protein